MGASQMNNSSGIIGNGELLSAAFDMYNRNCEVSVMAISQVILPRPTRPIVLC
jgi:hypothetical protein